MLSTAKLKKIINTDYNNLLSHIISKNSVLSNNDIFANNCKICSELFQSVMKKNVFK